jgi:hypothetical protein
MQTAETKILAVLLRAIIDAKYKWYFDMHVCVAGSCCVLIRDRSMTTVLLSMLFPHETIITSSDGYVKTPTSVQKLHTVSLKLYKGRSLIKWQHVTKAGCINNK